MSSITKHLALLFFCFFTWTNLTFSQGTLQINIQGNGSVLVNGVLYTEPVVFVESELVLIEAISGSNFVFDRWEGDLQGNVNPVQLLVDEDKNVEVVFRRFYFLSTTPVGGDQRFNIFNVGDKTARKETDFTLTAVVWGPDAHEDNTILEFGYKRPSEGQYNWFPATFDLKSGNDLKYFGIFSNLDFPGGKTLYAVRVRDMVSEIFQVLTPDDFPNVVTGDNWLNSDQAFEVEFVKAHPVVAWPGVSSIVYGQSLAEVQFAGGSAAFGSLDVPGQFDFEDPDWVPEAGQQEFNLTFTPVEEESFWVQSTLVEVTTAKAPATVQITELETTYNGSQQQPEFATVPEGLTLIVTYNGGSNLPVNAGTYEVVATVDDLNYQGSATATFEILKAEATVQITELETTYNGLPQQPEFATVPEGLTLEITYNGSTDLPVNAGIYEVVATLDDLNYHGSATATFEILKAPAIVQITELETMYNGLPQQPEFATVPEGLTLIITYNGGSDLPVNASTYEVVATVEDPNYQGTATATFEILKAEATVQITELEAVYNGSQQQPEFATIPEGLTLIITYNGGTDLPANAGTYEVVATVEDPNYQGTAIATFEILKAEATVQITELETTYSGSQQQPEFTTVPEGLTLIVTYNGGTDLPLNAGTYEVVATVEDPNYQGTATATFEILKATATVQITELETTYNGLSQQPAFATVPDDLTLIVTYNGGTDLPLNAGTYEVVATVEDPNYQGTATATFEILKATATVQITELETIYNGLSQQPEFATVPEGLTLIITYNGGSNLPVNAGTYEVVATVDDLNYQGSATATFEILKAEATVQITELETTYNGLPQQPEFATVPEGLTLEITYNGGTDLPLNAGNYEVVATVEDLNYQGTATATFEILKGEATVQIAELETTYNGLPQQPEFTTVPEGLTLIITYNGGTDLPLNAGTYEVVATVEDSNYAGSSSVIFVIQKVPLTIMADDKTKTYDNQVFSGFTVSFSGFISGEGPSNLLGGLVISGPAATATLAGEYTIVPGGFTSPNYHITFTEGMLVIEPAPLIVAAKNITKPEEVEYVFQGNEFTTTGLITASTDEVISVTLFSAGADASAAVGQYPILISGAQGMGLENYSITYTDGIMTVTDKIILVLAGMEASDKIYDGNTLAQITDYGELQGIDEGDEVILDTGFAVAFFANKHVGNNKPVTVSGLQLLGADADKYLLEEQFTTASITPRPLELSDFYAEDKIYDSTVSVTEAGFSDNRLEGDQLFFSFSATFESPDAGENKTVFFEDISLIGGADRLNYFLAATTGQASASILQAQIDVLADNKSKKFGEDDPILTYTITGGMLLPGNEFQGELSREPGEEVGVYNILQGNLSAGNNYQINFTMGQFSIEPAELTVVLLPQEAIAAGAQWSTDGENWYESGFALALSPGSYTLQFIQLPEDEWYSPSPLEINHGPAAQVEVVYIPRLFLTMLEPVGEGMTNPEEGIYDFPPGTLWELTAEPASQWEFSHWILNQEVYTDNPLSLVLTENTTAQAIFEEIIPETYTITFNVTAVGGSPILDATVTFAGITNLPGDYVFENILAGVYSYTVSRAGYVSVSSNASITQDRTINVILMPVTPPTYTVTFNVNDEYGEPVTHAVITFAGIVNPPGNYVFPGLSSGTYSYWVEKEGYHPATGSVNVNANLNVPVTLISTTFSLAIIHEGEGETDPPAGNYNVEKYTFIEVQAINIEGSVFTKWVVGEEEITSPIVQVFMDDNKTLVAHFEPAETFSLTIQKEGEGQTNPDEGVHFFPAGSEVSLQAIQSDPTFKFSKWLVEGLEFSTPEITLLMDGHKEATAVFVQKLFFDLVVSSSPGGTTDPVPGNYSFEENSEVTLLATPVEGYVFVKWVVNEQDYLQAELVLIMNEHKEAWALFELENSIADFDLLPGIALYPNPATEILYFQVFHWNGEGHMEIFDMQGRIVFSGYWEKLNTEQKVNVSGFLPGVYVMRLRVNNFVLEKRFIVR